MYQINLLAVSRTASLFKQPSRSACDLETATNFSHRWQPSSSRIEDRFEPALDRKLQQRSPNAESHSTAARLLVMNRHPRSGG